MIYRTYLNTPPRIAFQGLAAAYQGKDIMYLKLDRNNREKVHGAPIHIGSVDMSFCIALEHIRHLKSKGCGTWQAMQAIGAPIDGVTGWDDVVEAYAMAHQSIGSAQP